MSLQRLTGVLGQLQGVIYRDVEAFPLHSHLCGTELSLPAVFGAVSLHVPGLCLSLGSSSPIAGCTSGAQTPAGVLAQPQLSLRSFCAQILLIPHPACRTKAFPRCGILAEVGRGFLTVPEEQKVLWGILVWLCKIPA